ncbi:MAG: alpha-L-rhamnosidase N-terminal domain-containing protein [Sulfolobus sp.]|nr:alpha-L-rhamnosidase N-terminal domain-containing protein [Sulfolobus sp.]
MPPEKAVDLRCEYVVNPLGIDNPNPRFSFIPIHTERGQSITAYQIMVATDPKLLLEQKPDMWDSGKVNSTDPFNITYNGKPLESCKRYYWRVRWWDSKGNVSPWSDIAYFETGFLNKSDWHAKWIYGKQLFRKEFEITEDIISARAYIAALGYYELRINGKKVGDRVLDPGWTDYKKRVLYSVYDISDYLRKGKNVVGVILSEGRFLKQYGYDGVSKFIIQLRIKLSSGKEIEVISDENWLTSQGPIASSSIYDGEIYDARLEKDGCNRSKTSTYLKP